MRRINPAGIALVKEFEGLRLKSYLCPAGVWTIGYGHTGDVRPGQTWTATQAESVLAMDLAAFGQQVTQSLRRDASDNEFAAMVSLAFNVGIGGFRSSSVLRLHNAGDAAGAARAFLPWNKATVNGRLQELPGLTRRRTAESALYQTPDAMDETAVEMPQVVAPPEGAARSRTYWSQGVAGVGTAGTTFAGDIQGWVDTAKEHLGGLMLYVPSVTKIFVVLTIIGIAVTLYAKWDDRRKARQA